MTNRSVSTRWWMGDVVYLRVAGERSRGMIVGVLISPNGLVYSVQFEGMCSMHFEIELSSEFVHDFGVED